MTDAMDVYRERAHLVAHLTHAYPSVMAYSDPAAPDWPVVYINTPEGQLSWHISPNDVDLFAHVDLVDAGDPRAKWDGHDTFEKYRRLIRLSPPVKRCLYCPAPKMAGWKVTYPVDNVTRRCGEVANVIDNGQQPTCQHGEGHHGDHIANGMNSTYMWPRPTDGTRTEPLARSKLGGESSITPYPHR